MDEPKRKAFQDATDEDNLEYMKCGYAIFMYLKKRFPKEDTKDFDSILNSLCAAIYCFASEHVLVENQKQFVHLVYRILDKSLGEHEKNP